MVLKLPIFKDSDEEGVIEAKIEEERKPKLKLQLMVMERYRDVEKVLNTFRKGDIVLLVKVTPLRDRSLEELKKAIERLKAHCNVTGAEVAALDENWIILVPPVVEIAK